MRIIGKLLGHTQVQTTARYAGIAADPVKAAARQVPAALGQVVLGGETARRRPAGKGAIRDSVRRLLDLPFAVRCLDHGAPITADPHAALRNLLGWSTARLR